MAKWHCLTHLPEVLHVDSEKLFVLGALRYVVGSRLKKSHDEAVNDSFAEFLSSASELEPSEPEVSLAAAIEEASIALDVDIDVGESQLFAMAILRGNTFVASGDKRAVCGCAQIEPHCPQIEALRGKIISTEQVLAELIALVGYIELRERVCRERNADKTAAICFSCKRDEAKMEDIMAALASYQRDLAKRSHCFTTDCLTLRS